MSKVKVSTPGKPIACLGPFRSAACWDIVIVLIRNHFLKE
jgi:hypothetical protein